MGAQNLPHSGGLQEFKVQGLGLRTWKFMGSYKWGFISGRTRVLSVLTLLKGICNPTNNYL